MATLESYARIVGRRVIDRLRQVAAPLAGKSVVHVNSTRVGGGVAEILSRMIPLKCDLGLDASWEVIDGNPTFYRCTKGLHNGLQGMPFTVTDELRQAYQDTTVTNAARLRDRLSEADLVVIHDPQPAGLLELCPKRRGKWIWRCHIDLSEPHGPVWDFLQPNVVGYDASVWSLSDFVQDLPHPEYLIPPSIDPLAHKNLPMDEAEVDSVCEQFGIDRDRPLAVQVSRFDRFKDPIGVIKAYRLAKVYLPELQLVLLGGPADDDPEGAEMLAEVRAEAGDDRDVHILSLPPDAYRIVNAVQRAADVIIQKSLREGFGLTVTEGLWKGKPVIGGNTGGIRLQLHQHQNGFLVNTAEGAAQRLCYLMSNAEERKRMGQRGRRFVLEHYLLTRHLREYLSLMVALCRGTHDRVELA